MNAKQIAEKDILSPDRNNLSPEARLIEDQEISSLMLQVPYKLRSLLIMKYHQELSFEEIADVTGKSVSAVKMSIYRGLESLKKIMKD